MKTETDRVLRSDTEPGDRILEKFPHLSTPEVGLENLPHKGPLIAGGLLALFGLKRRGLLGIFSAGVAAGLLFRGARDNGLLKGGWKRHLMHTSPQRLVPFQRQIIIDRPVADVYRFWANLENLAIFLPHLRDIRPLDERRSHWQLKLSENLSLHWTAELLHQTPLELVVWRVQQPSDLYHEGWVRFTPLRDGASTMMTLRVYLLAPGGKVGATLVQWLERLPVRFFASDLQRFREIMEASTIDAAEPSPTLH